MRAFLLLLLVASLPASAQIYKYIDANGNTAYSNLPPDGTKSQTVELPPLNSVAPSKSTLNPAPAQPASTSQNRSPGSGGYSTLELTDIPTDEALRANNGTFTVGVKLEPRLMPPHQLRLVLDGKPYGQPSNVPRLQLVNIDRGEHNLAVQVINGEKILQQSPTLTFTVQRVHLP